MRYLILSDIHANWQALEAVLADAAGGYDEIVCCGDLVGYCADPNPVVDWVRGHVKAYVRGNHDKACCGLEGLEWFNPVAQLSALWTMRELSPENLAFLRQMPIGPAAVNGYSILHGSPADEDDYLVAVEEVKQIRHLLETELSFFGHTHLQGGFLIVRNGVIRIPKTGLGSREQVLAFEHDARYLVNPGSVGQPRDGDPRAAYILYDSAERELTYRRVAYDIAAAQRQILAAGLPPLLAERLSSGN